ncbi:hypothetical protein DL766_005187 [Monosporascus sp. MC13-8B]|uniref:Cytochrome P450 n=1 Tax=Monosporascus cannonballus TaxID=155416 RepID=A0ABY0HA91_9PEZI|nr:hypothetical protein DL762_003579 [Monosporascus cannonballus]RYO98184.1 hypothetical protein DL763_002425 [Monosporascus cannonballus]RYP29822.1 hypothetical protein DL766_005187 [Monosporascus sp. MC13-8B]
MATVAEALLIPQKWPASVWVLLLTGLATLAVQVFWRPALPKNAPKWWKGGDWPVLGALRFYSQRADFYREAISHSPSGNFSFYMGKKHLIGLSGPEARRTFYDSRELSLNEGFAELSTGQPPADSTTDNFSAFFNRHLVAMLKKENFVKNLDLMAGDTRKACEALAAAPPSKADPSWKVTNPFDSLYQIVYQLTMRTVGANDIAEDPVLLRKTLSMFEQFEKSNSTLKVVFPWFPAPNHLFRIYNAARLGMVFQKLIDQRTKTGKKGNDALQYLIDQGVGIRDIIAFQIGALFAGQINSGINAAWVHVHLARNPEWLARVREEVDAAVARHRREESQTPADVLSTLTVDDWESEFPLIDLCLRESIRMNLPGTAFRKNVSSRDIPVGSAGEVIPAGAFATYWLDEVHMDESLYPYPQRFDPGRYFENRAEDKKVHHGFLGWGSGRHPCLGMKFAKLEMAVITAYFVATFDFELSDKDGNLSTKAPRPVGRNQKQAEKPKEPIYLRYKPRAQQKDT